MTDRELLELAAKAAGHQIEWVSTRLDDNFVARIRNENPYWFNWPTWNPLDDDGDALRLAVKLRMLIGAHSDESWAQWYGRPEGGWITIKGRNGDDPCAALRRAIVLCAVEIGRIKVCNT